MMAGAAAIPALVAPMSYLEGFGPRAHPVVGLAWGLIILSLAVSAIITVLVLTGTLTRRVAGGDSAAFAPRRGPGGLRWIVIGLILTVVALIVSLVWTMEVLAAVNAPPHRARLTIEVTGHQWWWEAHYLDGNQSFTTANELHIPVGEPVLLKLTGGDVIHSFWVPALTGKTDTIPSRTNVSWIEADRPGRYVGQCTEYCGVQHAHMAVYVIADPPAAYQAWRAGQLQPAPVAADVDASAGEMVVVARCGSCHTIRGTDAGGVVGPDLTHLMSRSTLASGTLPNNPLALRGWIENPEAIKPGVKMPPTFLPAKQLAQATAYLETLK